MSCELLPVVLDLYGKTLLFVGGGKATLHKLALLVQSGIFSRQQVQCVIVAPRIESELLTLAAQHGFTCHQREFVPADLTDIDLVWAYTDQAALNQQIARLARAQRIFASVAGVRGEGGFMQPAVHRQAVGSQELVLAISTGGQDPGLAVHWRDRLAIALGDMLPEKEQT